MPSFYGATEKNIRDHVRDHQRGLVQTATDKRPYCRACYPNNIPVTSTRFNTFWNWISHTHGAGLYNGYTRSAFEHFNLQFNNPHTTLNEQSEITIQLIRSIRFRDTETPIVELCYYFHNLFINTNGFRNPITTALVNRAQERYRNPAGSPVYSPTRSLTPVASPTHTPPGTPPLVNPNPIQMADAAAVRDGLIAVFGAQGAHIRPENNVIKLDFFYGKKTEDPVSWLAAFNKAKETNNWRDERRVKIAAGYLKGEAAEWYEGKKTDITDHWASGDNGQNNFTDQFNLQFNTEQRKNEWFHELWILRQKEDESVDAYAAKFIKLTKRVNLTDDAQKKRMFLHSLKPSLIPFVQLSNPANLNEAIAAARRTEAGFNLS
ncbi:MAG: hypothetical protein E6H08_11560, partial [Bacteroidetes bacterium]